MVIDIHTHAFPDSLALRAIALLEGEGDVTAQLDGTVGALIGSMNVARIDASVVATIATKPEQSEPILSWCREIASDRIVPFPSVHPDDPQASDRIEQIKDTGFRGIKLHPYYQEFSLDEERVFALLQQIERAGLVLLLHSGFDIAFARYRVADPPMIRRVTDRLPGLKLIAAHLGGWEDWDKVESHLLGQPVYIDTSYSLPLIGAERARHFLSRHPEEYLLFGSDSPWSDQGAARAEIEALGLSERLVANLLGGNARKLLGL